MLASFKLKLVDLTLIQVIVLVLFENYKSSLWVSPLSMLRKYKRSNGFDGGCVGTFILKCSPTSVTVGRASLLSEI